MRARLRVRDYIEGDCLQIKPKSHYVVDPAEIHKNVENIFKSGTAWMFTILIDEEPIAIISAVSIANGICELMAVISDRVYECPVFFARACLKCMDTIQKKFQFHRFQTIIRTDIKSLHKWAKFLGMTEEGVMRQFYEKVDHTIYARTY